MADSKTLVLVRHAKSSWRDSILRDHDRPLNARGIRDAPRMADRLLSRGVSPQQIICSSAARALTTARVFSEQLGLESVALVVKEEVYGAGYDEMIELIQNIDDHCHCAMVVGHNPTFTELASGLTAGEVGYLPTCAVVTLAVDSGDWFHAGSGRMRLLDFDFPKKDQR